MKISRLLLLLLFVVLSCEREQAVQTPPEDPLVSKIAVRVLSPGAVPYNNEELTIDFSYDHQNKLIRRTGGFLPISGSTGYNYGPFTKLLGTSLAYTGNKVVVENFSTSTEFTVPKNTRNLTLNPHQQIETREISNANVYLFKRETYIYKGGKLDEIKTTFPNMPYDPTDPNDYIYSFSEKFFFNSAGNLIRTEYVELQDGVPSPHYKRVRLFENFDNSYNPFKRFTLLDEYFYRSLSKNNFRTYREILTQNGTSTASVQEWEFNYDSAGNIIIN